MQYEKMSKAELIRFLKSLEAASGAAPTVNLSQYLLQEMQFRQVALAAQNQELHENDERFQQLLEKLPAGAYTCDADGLITYFNSQAIALWGRKPKLNDAEDRYCGSFKLYSSDGAPINREKCWMALAIENDEAYNGHEIVIERPDGSRLTVLAHANPIHDVAGKLIGAVNMLVDISDHKRTEILMARLAAIIESSDDAIISKDLNGIIESWNRGAEKLFGYTAAEIIGRPVTDLIPFDRLDEEPQILDRLKRGEKIDHYETVRRRKDGSEIDISITVSPILDTSGKVIGASKIARDITERKRIEIEREELLHKESVARVEAEAANRSKDEFLALVSHELRSPMNAINGWAKLLREGKLDPHDADKALVVIERNSQAQIRLVEDLLDTARIVTGKLLMELSPLDINPVISDAIDVVRSAAEAKGVEMRANYGPRPELVAGDATRLRQIVWNLLSNAIKFTPTGGCVKLYTERADDNIRIIVSDTGEGIQPEFLPYIFDRFRQADSSISRRHGGLGLGLSLVKHLSELHGGEVYAASEGAGRGATFTVTLPLATRTKLVSANTPALKASDGWDVGAKTLMEEDDDILLPAGVTIEGLRALVVDDEEDARALLSRLLTQNGAIAMTVSSGDEAMAILSEPPNGAKPDILICDIVMPEENGYALLRRVRTLEASRGIAASEQIPAIALTALNRSEDRMRALSAGFQSHVTKPVEAIELILVISNLRSLWRQAAE